MKRHDLKSLFNRTRVSDECTLERVYRLNTRIETTVSKGAAKRQKTCTGRGGEQKPRGRRYHE